MKGLQRPSQAVVVEQCRRDREELLQRRLRGPAGDVVERRGRREPAGYQRAHDLAGRELGAPALRQKPIDRLGDPELRREVAHEQERPDLSAHAVQRRVEPRKGARQLLELARRLELPLAPESLEHAVAHPPLIVAVGLDQAQVHVALLPPADGVALDIHVGPTLQARSDGTDRHTRIKLALHNEPLCRAPRRRRCECTTPDSQTASQTAPPRQEPPATSAARKYPPTVRKMELAPLAEPLLRRGGLGFFSRVNGFGFWVRV